MERTYPSIRACLTEGNKDTFFPWGELEYGSGWWAEIQYQDSELYRKYKDSLIWREIYMKYFLISFNSGKWPGLSLDGIIEFIDGMSRGPAKNCWDGSSSDSDSD